MSHASHAQHGIWFTERAGGAGTAYHLGLSIWLDGELDVPALDDACAAVLARHPVLGTALSEVDGVLHVVPAASPPPVRRAVWSDTLVRDELAVGFDLARGPLARWTLATAGPGRHLLLFVAHHTVFDGTSKEILVRDLAAAYSGAPLDPLPEFVVGAAEPTKLAAAREFWLPRWHEPGDVVLPDLRRTPITAEPGDSVESTMDPTALAAGELGVTRFELLLSAVAALLWRYGNPVPVLAVDVSTRTPETADHIGLFVNELPVFASGGPTFADLARSVRAELRQAYAVRDVPLAHAVGGLTPRAALAPVSVSYRRRASDPKFAGLDATVDWMLFAGAARNALHIQAVDGPDRISLSLRYSPTALDRDAAARIGSHLTTLLAAAVARPSSMVEELPVLPPAETERVLHRWNATARPYPREATLIGLFETSARATPDALAVDQMTYRELDARASALAGRLNADGIGRGDLVAVTVPRSPDLLVALLGIGKAGAAYLPLDPAYPPDRTAFVLADARPAACVDHGQTRDISDPAMARLSMINAVAADLAYVIYTSGSTGRPKGVEVTHGALANLLLSLRDDLGAGPRDIWLGLTSLSFDISTVELFLPLCTGGRVVMAGEDAGRDGAAVVRLARDQGVTHIQATPSGWRVLLDAGFADPSVTALAGGETLPAPLAAELHGRVRRLVNVYGPTETTVWSTMDVLAGDMDVTIGRPLANTRAYVLDAAMRPVPAGVPGELFLGGAGVARGYRGRSGLTADRFVPDPFGPPGARLYRTGDRVSHRQDGRLVFHGRLDNQVKIRGHRIEPGEIEARLLDHPAVDQAAVVARDDGLVAYLVGAVPTPGELRDHLARSLPAAMVPGVFVLLERLPLTPNGKLDRAALPAPPRPAAMPVTAPAAPGAPAAPDPAGPPGPPDGDGVLEAVRGIWQDVLRIEDIGVEEDLFDLGGHSLTITQMMSRIRKRLGVQLGLDVFFETPTIAGIVEAIRGASGAASSGASNTASSGASGAAGGAR